MASFLNSRFISNYLWGVFVKIVDAAVKFFTIPILVSYFGREDYGLIALAVSLNTYLQIMDLGMNVGSIRYFSIWLSQKKYDKITEVTQSSLLFYGGIGSINALIILWIAFNPIVVGIEERQFETARWIFLTLAGSVVFNWMSNVITQLLTANNQLSEVNKSLLVANIVNMIGVVITVYMNKSLNFYFAFYTVSNLLVLPLNLYTLRKFPIDLLKLLLPKWNWQPFKEIVLYSISIFAIGVFQFSANHLRPLLLTRQANEGISILTDYRIIQTIAGLAMMLGGVLLQVLLPTVSKLYAEGNHEKIKRVVFEGTKLSTLFVTFLCSGIIVCSKELLFAYVGSGFVHLSDWLSIWMITVLMTMHNSPVASIVLATGNTRPLVLLIGFACIVSLPITYAFAPTMGIGAAVTGYLVYMIIVIGGYYCYYIPKVLNYSSVNLFLRSVMPNLLVGVITWGIINTFTNFFTLENVNPWTMLIGKGLIFFTIFFLLAVFIVYTPSQIKTTLQSLRTNNE